MWRPLDLFGLGPTAGLVDRAAEEVMANSGEDRAAETSPYLILTVGTAAMEDEEATVGTAVPLPKLFFLFPNRQRRMSKVCHPREVAVSPSDHGKPMVMTVGY